MKRTKTGISVLVAAMALTLSLSACGNGGETNGTTQASLSASDNKPETEAPATTNIATEQTTSAAETTIFKAEHPADAIYNTSIEPNISDDIKFKVVIRADNNGDGYIEHNVPIGNLQYDGGITIDDLEYTISDDYVYTLDVERENNSYMRETPIDIYMRCYGIEHRPASGKGYLYLELATENGDILTDSTEVKSTSVYRVKALSACWSSVAFIIVMPDGSEYEIDRSLEFSTIRQELNKLLGTTREQTSASTDSNNQYMVLKNTNWTLIMDNGGYGDSASFITLINNNI